MGALRTAYGLPRDPELTTSSSYPKVVAVPDVVLCLPETDARGGAG